MKYSSTSPRVTQKIASLLAQEIVKNPPRLPHALVIALQGDLGSGKTTFVQGFARGLGLKKRLTSPTFLIIRSYKLKKSSYKLLFHVDAYRIKKTNDLHRLGWKEMMRNKKHIVLVEWAENVKRVLPKNKITITFEHEKKENERGIIIEKK